MSLDLLAHSPFCLFIIFLSRVFYQHREPSESSTNITPPAVTIEERSAQSAWPHIQILQPLGPAAMPMHNRMIPVGMACHNPSMLPRVLLTKSASSLLPPSTLSIKYSIIRSHTVKDWWSGLGDSVFIVRELSLLLSVVAVVAVTFVATMLLLPSKRGTRTLDISSSSSLPCLPWRYRRCFQGFRQQSQLLCFPPTQIVDLVWHLEVSN